MLSECFVSFLTIHILEEWICLALKKEDLITDVLKLIAPGTAIREGLENILKAKTRSTYCYW